MLIVCPACACEYEIEAERLGPAGRAVRCASCHETWHVAPETPDNAPGSRADPEEATTEFDSGTQAPEIVDHPMPPPSPRLAEPPRAGAKAGLFAARIRMPSALAAGFALLALLPLALLGRASLVQAMPRSATLFSAIGLPVNLRGIDLVDVAAFQNPAEGGEPAKLVVEGSLRNVAGERVAVLPLDVALHDAHGQVLYRWSAPPPRASLEADETARFRASLSAPPAQGYSVRVRFSTQQGASKDAGADLPASAGAHADTH